MANFKTPTDEELASLYMTDTTDLDQSVGSFLWVWGTNLLGQLGTNDKVNRSHPTQTIAGGTNWKSVTSGYDFTTAIKNDGTLWSWGHNFAGQLGTNDKVHRSSPVQVFGGGNTWKQTACGIYHAAAIKNDGTLWVWGYNNLGQLGTNDKVHRSSPVQVFGGGTDWKLVACGGYNTMGIKTDGTLWIWGHNAYGQLGTNDIIHRSSPVQTVLGGNNWKDIACGQLHTAAIKNDGTLWLWGANNTGQLGINSIENKLSPVQVFGGGVWKKLHDACYVAATGAIKNDGTLWTWGYDPYIGDGSFLAKSIPVQTSIAGSTWKSVTLGAGFVSAIPYSET